MGKGDKKTKKGKINIGSFGKHRPHKVTKPAAATESKQTENSKSKDKK